MDDPTLSVLTGARYTYDLMLNDDVEDMLHGILGSGRSEVEEDTCLTIRPSTWPKDAVRDTQIPVCPVDVCIHRQV